MRSSLLLICFIVFSACSESDSCERINKSSDCLKYNNCNILVNWNLKKIEMEYSSADSSYSKTKLYKDIILMHQNGTMEFRTDNVLSPLNKWEFPSCAELKLSSSTSDTSIVMTIDKMETNAMIWKYNSIYNDGGKTWNVLNTLYFERL